MQDKLYMLSPDFFKGSEGPFYCGDSLLVEGLLGFYPQLRNKIEVHYIGAQKPRQVIVEVIGEENQSAPVIVLSNDSVIEDASIEFKKFGAWRFIDTPSEICRYLSTQYDVAVPA